MQNMQPQAFYYAAHFNDDVLALALLHHNNLANDWFKILGHIKTTIKIT